jgi:hypothetical protein
MTTQLKPLTEINHQAIRVLSEQIGLVDTLRFINQFTNGHGDYTQQRDALFGHLTLDEIMSAVEQRRSSEAPKIKT